MNKSNKILLGVLAFVVACVMGYALFSENITVTGTASTSGNWKIATTCETGISASVVSGWSSQLDVNEIIKEGGYGDSTCTVSGDTITMQTELKYPTATRAFTMKFKNEGTIDAFLYQNGTTPIQNQSITIYNSNNSVYKQLTSSSSEFNTYLKQFGQFRQDVLPIIKTSSGSILTEANWQSRIYEKINKTDEYEYYLKLEPGDTLEIVAWAYWDENATMNNGMSAKTVAATIAMFEQMSPDMIEAPDGFTCFSGC